MDCSVPGFLVHHQPPEFTQLPPLSRWCHPTISSSVIPFSSFLQSFAASGSFQMSLHIRWPKFWSFSFSISPSNEYSELTSFRMDLLDFLAVQGALKSLLQHHSLKASILRCSAFFIVQLSHQYMTTTTGKTIALTRQTFFAKVISLLFNMLSRLVINFLPKSKCLFISRLQSWSAVILEPRKIKPVMVSTVSPSICHEVMGPDAMIFVFWMLSFKPTFCFPGGSEGKASACNAGDLGLIPESGRSPGEGNGNLLCTLTWKTPCMEKPGRLQSMGLQRVGHDWVTSLTHSFWLSSFTLIKEGL